MRACLSQRILVAVGSEGGLIGIGFPGPKAIVAKVAIHDLARGSVTIAVVQSDDDGGWVPIGVSETVTSDGQVELAASGLTAPAVALEFTADDVEGHEPIALVLLIVTGGQQ